MAGAQASAQAARARFGFAVVKANVTGTLIARKAGMGHLPGTSWVAQGSRNNPAIGYDNEQKAIGAAVQTGP